MIYNYFVLGLFFVMTFVLGMGTGVSMALIQTVHAQSTNTTVSVPVPITVPVLQYSPPTSSQQQAPPAQENQGITEVIVSIVVTAVGVITAKMHSDRKSSTQDKDIMATILHDKQIQAELARVMYSLNSDKAKEINDAPAVKLENLEKETKEYSERAAKA